ncbi:unnamed protein product [Urochloa humidicola]
MVMASGGGDGSPASARFSSSPGCRMRKRRRLAAPPAVAAGSSGSGGGGAAAGPSRDKHKRVRPASPSTSSSSLSDADSSQDEGEQGEGGVVDAEEEEEELPPAGPPPPQQQIPAAARAWPVAFGSLSVAGRSRDMEDTVSLRPGFFTWADGSPMHFFAVFDGHGGSHVAELCRDRMHEFLAEELAAEAAAFPRHHHHHHQAAAAGEGSTSAAGAAMSSAQQQGKEEERAWRAALHRAFRRVDAVASRACACGRVASPPCRCPLSGSSGIVGSTAVVAVLVRGRVVVANCGDSRAVLCRRRGPAGAGAAAPVPLSDDHKPSRPDELARIQAAGGRVVFNNGHRVRGILAMSRALGDRMLRPEVIAEPEITVTDRTPEDECLILASDGMWDAVPNEIACSVARQCLQDGNPAAAPVEAAGGGEGAAAAGPEPAARCSNAASLLVRLAFGRDSWDNISVIVIDLQRRE